MIDTVLGILPLSHIWQKAEIDLAYAQSEAGIEI